MSFVRPGSKERFSFDYVIVHLLVGQKHEF